MIFHSSPPPVSGRAAGSMADEEVNLQHLQRQPRLQQKMQNVFGCLRPFGIAPSADEAEGRVCPFIATSATEAEREAEEEEDGEARTSLPPHYDSASPGDPVLPLAQAASSSNGRPPLAPAAPPPSVARPPRTCRRQLPWDKKEEGGSGGAAVKAASKRNRSVPHPYSTTKQGNAYLDGNKAPRKSSRRSGSARGAGVRAERQCARSRSDDEERECAPPRMASAALQLGTPQYDLRVERIRAAMDSRRNARQESAAENDARVTKIRGRMRPAPARVEAHVEIVAAHALRGLVLRQARAEAAAPAAGGDNGATVPASGGDDVTRGAGGAASAPDTWSRWVVQMNGQSRGPSGDVTARLPLPRPPPIEQTAAEVFKRLGLGLDSSDESEGSYSGGEGV